MLVGRLSLSELVCRKAGPEYFKVFSTFTASGLLCGRAFESLKYEVFVNTTRSTESLDFLSYEVPSKIT